jgi:tetratricopeptide (TPR) repeat protein
VVKVKLYWVKRKFPRHGREPGLNISSRDERKMNHTCGLKLFGCIALSLLSATAGLGAAAGTLAEADGLLNSPALSMTQATRALSLYQGLLATAGADRVVVLAHLGRACFVLGQLVPEAQAMGYYQQGQSYAETLIREEPNRVEGHYWLGLNLCGQADVGGKLLGHRLLPRILEELKRAVALDGAYDQAGAHRVLGRIYYEAPGWPLSVGDMQKSRQHLQAAVRLAPAISTNHLYLAQTLSRLNEAGLARQELEQVLKSTRGAIKPQDLEEDRQEARRLLAEMEGGEAR